jgi:hypothetical protein
MTVDLHHNESDKKPLVCRWHRSADGGQMLHREPRHVLRIFRIFCSNISHSTMFRTMLPFCFIALGPLRRWWRRRLFP